MGEYSLEKFCKGLCKPLHDQKIVTNDDFGTNKKNYFLNVLFM